MVNNIKNKFKMKHYFYIIRAKNLEKTINEYQPVQTIIEQVLNSLNEWKQKMYNFIDQYSEQIKIHIEQAQSRLNDQWNIAKEEYLQMLDHFVLDPIDQLLKCIYFSFQSKREYNQFFFEF